MAPSRPSSLADSASSGAGGTRPTAPAAASVIRPKEASAAAQATTRRSDDNAASSGTTTIHGTRKDVMLPVSQAVKVIRPAKFAAEIRCARLNLPVRDKQMRRDEGLVAGGGHDFVINGVMDKRAEIGAERAQALMDQ